MEGEQGEGWPWKKLLLIGGGALLLSGGLYLSYRFVRNYLRSNEVQTLLQMANQYESTEDFAPASMCMLELIKILDEMGVEDSHPMRYFACSQIYTWSSVSFRYDTAKHYALECARLFPLLVPEEIENHEQAGLAMRHLGLWVQHNERIFQDIFTRLEKYLIKVEAHAQLSLLYFTEASFEVGRGNFEKALEIYETKAQHELDVSGAQPSNSPELVTVVQVPILLHAELGNYEKALELIEKAITYTKDRHWLLLHKANALANMGRVEEGIQIYKELFRKQKAARDELSYISMMGSMCDFCTRFGLDKMFLKFQKKILRNPNIPPLSSSKYFGTKLAMFTWRPVRDSADDVTVHCALLLEVRNARIPDPCFLEIEWGSHIAGLHKEEEKEPIIEDLEYSFSSHRSVFWKCLLSLKSPALHGIHGNFYMVTVRMYSDSKKETLVSTHKQLVSINYPTNKISRKAAEKHLSKDFEIDL